MQFPTSFWIGAPIIKTGLEVEAGRLISVIIHFMNVQRFFVWKRLVARLAAILDELVLSPLVSSQLGSGDESLMTLAALEVQLLLMNHQMMCSQCGDSSVALVAVVTWEGAGSFRPVRWGGYFLDISELRIYPFQIVPLVIEGAWLR